MSVATMSKLALAAMMASTVTATTCDIYDAAGTPCVAAHSVVRALYKAYAVTTRLYANMGRPPVNIAACFSHSFLWCQRQKLSLPQ